MSKIATLMLVDLCNFTALSENTSRRSLVAIISQLQNIINQAIVEFNGQEERTLGDAVVCSFVSAQEALRASERIQTQISEENTEKSNSQLIQVKIALCTGDISHRFATEKLISRLIKLEKLIEPGKTWATESTFLLLASYTHFTPVGYFTESASSEDERLYEVLNRFELKDKGITYPAPPHIRYLAGIIDLWAAIFMVILLGSLPRIVELQAWFFDTQRFPLMSLTQPDPERSRESNPDSMSDLKHTAQSEPMLWQAPPGFRAGEYLLRVAYSADSTELSNLTLKIPEGSIKLNPGFYDGLKRIKTLSRSRLREGDKLYLSNQYEENGNIKLHYIELVPVSSNYVPQNLERISPLSALYHIINLDPKNPSSLLLRIALTTLMLMCVCLSTCSSTPGGMFFGLKFRHRGSLSAISPWASLVRSILFLAAPLWGPSCLRKNLRWSDRITNTEVVITKHTEVLG